jgi:hypothetical protein
MRRPVLRLVYHISIDETYEKSIQVEPEAEALDGVLVSVENIRPHSCEGFHCIWGPWNKIHLLTSVVRNYFFRIHPDTQILTPELRGGQ